MIHIGRFLKGLTFFIVFLLILSFGGMVGFAISEYNFVGYFVAFVAFVAICYFVGSEYER